MQINKFIIAIFFGTLFSNTYANPVIDNIAAGTVKITPTDTHLEINQTTPQAILNWKSFNISAPESVHFQQPNHESFALNRINPTQGASGIFGKLSSTGTIILINPAGIHFGPTAHVNVAGIIASTANISDKNFLAGQYIFDQPSSYQNAKVINAGKIVAADHGFAAFLAPHVENTGHIHAHLGQVALGSGEKFTLNFSGKELIHFTVDSQKVNKLVNTGKITTDGGKVFLSADGAKSVLDNVVKRDYSAEATHVRAQGNKIILSAGSSFSDDEYVMPSRPNHTVTTDIEDDFVNIDPDHNVAQSSPKYRQPAAATYISDLSESLDSMAEYLSVSEMKNHEFLPANQEQSASSLPPRPHLTPISFDESAYEEVLVANLSDNYDSDFDDSPNAREPKFLYPMKVSKSVFAKLNAPNNIETPLVINNINENLASTLALPSSTSSLNFASNPHTSSTIAVNNQLTNADISTEIAPHSLDLTELSSPLSKVEKKNAVWVNNFRTGTGNHSALLRKPFYKIAELRDENNSYFEENDSEE